MNSFYRRRSSRPYGLSACIEATFRATFRATLLAMVLVFIPSLSFAIDAPRDTRGTQVRATVIKWQWAHVNDARQYEVTVNGQSNGLTTDTYLYSRGLGSGAHTMTVKAVDGNGRYSSPSATARQSIGGAPASNDSDQGKSSSGPRSPGDVRGTVVRNGEVKWEWRSVDEAVRYDVVVNGVHQALTGNTYFYSRNLSDGTHSMSVKAIDGDWKYSSKSRTVNVSVSNGSSAGSSSNASTSNDSPEQPGKQSGLQAPKDVRGTEVRTAEVKWEWEPEPGASKYEVSVDGNYMGLTSNTYMYTPNLSVGEHTMTVKSVSPEGRYSDRSETARRTIGNAGGSNSNNNDSGGSLPAPKDPRGTEVRAAEIKWEWEPVQGAVQYEVTVDGNSGLTPDTFLYTSDLSNGEHRMSVKAVAENGSYSASSDTVVRSINSSTLQIENQNVVAASPAPPAPSSAPAPAADDNGLVDPASWSQPDVQAKLGEYRLTFSDEFNADRLNSNRWNARLRWDGSHNGERYEYRVVNGEQQLYVNIFSDDQEHHDRVVSMHNPFEFDGSRLAIRAVRNPASEQLDDPRGYGPLSRIIRRQNFLSGAITTFDKFTQKYGYFEARIKIPSTLGTFPAFWLHHQRREREGTQRTEIDIMENLGHAPWYIYNSFHYYTGVSEGVSGTPHFIKPKPQGQIYTGTDYSEQYHVYAAEWKPGYIKYMIDGEKVSEVWNDAVNHEDLYLLLNLAIGGNWTNYPSNAGGTGRPKEEHFPTQNDINNWPNPALEIDYVRAYKRK